MATMTSMPSAIADFFHNAARLYRHLTHVRAEDVGNVQTAASMRDSFAHSFKHSTEALRPYMDKGKPAGESSPELDLAKACWKISQDVLLRLNKPSAQVAGHEETTLPAKSCGTIWSDNDIEAFGNRLLELQAICRRKWPSQDDKMAEMFQSLTLTKVSREETSSRDENSVTPSLNNGGDPHGVPSELITDFIVEALSFKSMKNREEEVADAHGDTFNWIFKHKSGDSGTGDLGDQFTKWLRCDELGNIYWITGKPGAGKSTLLRYVAEHEKTGALLKTWADSRDMIKAVFYFWTSGSEEQRSQIGLLRYLLHQLISHAPELTPKAFPELWHTLSSMSTSERIRFSVEWNVTQLINGFHLFVHHALESRNICLFVDGLDEFDGNHRELINFFRDLSKVTNKHRIKLCLSSRPWPIFEDAFQHTVPNLKLQELTFRDMRQYIKDNLFQSVVLRSLLAADPLATESLVRRIVYAAEGVFLWTRLVVRKILEIHGANSTLADVETFLGSLPSDLDHLFTKLLFEDQSVEKLQRSSHLFQLVHARETVADFVRDESSNTLSIWEISFAEVPPTSETVYGHFEEVSDQEIQQRCTNTLRHVTLQSTGLLEVYSRRIQGNLFESSSRSSDIVGGRPRRLARCRVTYLHRTVRDYLLYSPGIWDRLVRCSSATFDPHLALLQSHVQRLQHPIEPIEHHRRLDEWYPEIALSLTHARYVSIDHLDEQVKPIDKLDEGISWYWDRRAGDPYDHWARGCFGTYEARKGNKMVLTQPFLALCTKFGLEKYVLTKIDTLAQSEDSQVLLSPEASESLVQEETPLLTYALQFLTSRQKTLMPLSSPSFIWSLLHNPHLHDPVIAKLIGTPNMLYSSPLTKTNQTTPWLLVLIQLRNAKRRGWIELFEVGPAGTERWITIVEMLVKEGQADLGAFLEWNGFDEECYARDVLTGLKQLGAIDDWWVHDLKKLYEDRRENNQSESGQ